MIVLHEDSSDTQIYEHSAIVGLDKISAGIDDALRPYPQDTGNAEPLNIELQT